MIQQRAIPDSNTDGGYRFVPFEFQYADLAPGRELDVDVELYRAFSEGCAGLHPSWCLLLFLGDEAMELYLRRADTSQRWKAFQREVGRRHPDIDARTAQETAAVKATAQPRRNRKGGLVVWDPTMPEVLFGSSLLEALPDGMRVAGDAALSGPLPRGGQVPRCDYELSTAASGRPSHVRVEIFGFLDRSGQPRTDEGARYAARRLGRLQIYAEAGLKPPIIIYADEICDPRLRADAVVRVINAQEEGSARR